MSTPTTDPGPLDRERSHLAASRTALRAMRADAESLDIRDVTANWVNAEVLQRQIEARIEALADLAHTPLFFGRLDYTTRRAPSRRKARRASGSTSGAAMCTTATATRWSSTGAPRSPSPSTGRPARTRWTWHCAAASATPAAT